MRPIESYALIGDRRTAALVGTDGSIDWLCLPRFDDPACMAALLGSHEHGHWQLTPCDDHEVTRRYVGDSTALETTFTTSNGTLVLTDDMPWGDDRVDVVRTLRCTKGRVRVRHRWRIRFDYGQVRPWVRRVHLGHNGSDGEAITATAGRNLLVLRGPRLPAASDHVHSDELEMAEGDELTFTMTWLPSYTDLAGVEWSTEDRTRESIAAEEAWASNAPGDVPHADAVRRSLLTLRLMTHSETGGIVAAPTTSLPEDFGGERNWDYRYCWLRDAALTVSAMLRAGFGDEADLWREWLLRAVAGDPEDLQIVYSVDGERRLAEYELPGLPGYADSRPVRVGNGAVDQVQNDVLGEVMDALHEQRMASGEADHSAWALQKALVGELATRWKSPDQGLWEIRGEPQHFVHSRVMVWVAFDRAVRAIEDFGLDGPLEAWRGIRDAIHEEVLAHGYRKDRNTFVQHYDTDELDAALLLLPAVGFLDHKDPRILGTIAAIEEDLLRDGLVLRYRTQSGVDGLGGDEHPFLACSFWLVRAYAGAGRHDEAAALFDRLIGMTNDVGLLSEEYDPGKGRMVGNFPQAFSHLALIQAALALATGEG